MMAKETVARVGEGGLHRRGGGMAMAMGPGGCGLAEWLEGISCGGLLGGLDDYGVETVGDLLLLDPPDIKALAGTIDHPPALHGRATLLASTASPSAARPLPRTRVHSG